MPRVLSMEVLTLTGGGWNDNDRILMAANENLAVIQTRDASIEIRIALDQGQGRSGNYVTVRANTARLFSSFNFDNEPLYVNGPAGAIVEILKQIRP